MTTFPTEAQRPRFIAAQLLPDGLALVCRTATDSLLAAETTAHQRFGVVVYIPVNRPTPEIGDRVKLAAPRPGLRRSLA